MKNMKFWRTALVATLVLTIMLSVTGGTIAWFTDEVTSAANVIKSGNLDVKLEYKNVKNGVMDSTWNDATNATIFNYDKWEPGYTETKYVKVSNAGSLAFNFKLTVAPTLEVAEGEANLADVIEVYMGVGEAPAKSADLHQYTPVGTVSSLAADEDGVAYGKMYANDVEEMWVALHMQESAGNEYQGKSVGDGFKLKLFVTQLTYEEDSFGDDYDADAIATVYDVDGLKSALANGGKAILGADIVIDEYLTIPEGKAVTLDLNGKELSKSSDTSCIIRNYGKLTLTGEGTIDGTMGNYAVRNESGSELTVNAGVVIDGGFGAISSFGGKLTINGGDFSNEESNTTHYVLYATNNSTVVINGGSFTFGADQYAGSNGSPILAATNGSSIEINGGTFDAQSGSSLCYAANNIVIKGGTFMNAAQGMYSGSIEAKVASGYKVNKVDGIWTVYRNSVEVSSTEGNTSAQNGEALAAAINATNEATYLELSAGEYKMPSITGTKEVTITGTKDTVIDVTTGAYMDNSTVAFEGVTIKTSTDYVKDEYGNKGSDYAALYTPNVTYTNCTFVGPMRIGRDGAKFINCTFTELGNDYVWTYGNDCEFIGCTFNTDGKAILIYSDGGNEVSKVTVKDCVFNSTTGAKASAIANQNCAAIEIHNYGNGVNLTTSGNTYDSNFSGEWRIKTYEAGKPDVIVNGTEYTKTALDGKLMTVTNSEATYD